MTLLPDGTIQIHSIETQTLTQIIQAPQTTSELLLPEDRRKLAWSPAGFLVPSSQRFNKLRPSPVKLVRSVARVPAPPEPMEGEEIS